MNGQVVNDIVYVVAAILSGSGIGWWTYRATTRRHAAEPHKGRRQGMNGYTTVIRDAANRIEELRAEVDALREERSQLMARLAECEQQREQREQRRPRTTRPRKPA